MGIFKKTEGATAPKKTAKPKAKAKAAAPVDEVLTPESQTVSQEKAVAAAPAKGQAGESYRILRAPRVSEKAAISASKNVYVFEVPLSAEKIEIAKAVEKLYGVKVLAVNTARGIGKVLAGRRKGSRSDWKKAYVRVKPGQKIDLYEGV